MGRGVPGNSQAEGRAAPGPGMAAGATVGGGEPPSCMGRKGPLMQSRGRVVVMAESTGRKGEEGAGDTLAGEGPPWEDPLYTSKQCPWLPTHEKPQCSQITSQGSTGVHSDLCRLPGKCIQLARKALRPALQLWGCSILVRRELWIEGEAAIASVGSLISSITRLTCIKTICPPA